MAPHSNARRTAEEPRFEDALRRALALRAQLFGKFREEPSTSAYRLIHSEGDGVPGVAVDAYAGCLLVQVLDERELGAVEKLEKHLAQTLEPSCIVRKLRYRQVERGRVPGEVVHGEAPRGPVRVLENAMPFEVELLEGLHTGLFTDMREERARLRSLAAGRRVLNTFAYTGAFSVAAALGGAAQVTSVDVVNKVLDRAKHHFELAGIDPARHHFARMEVLEFLSMAARRGWAFDAIVLDPPTFATFRSGRWSAKSGYPELLRLAIAVLAQGGLLWAAANTESLPQETLERQITAAFREAKRSCKVIAVGGLPPDYPTPPDQPKARYLKVYVLEA